MIDEIAQHRLTPDEARTWLRHIVRQELTRIQRTRHTLHADGGHDLGADWAMSESWRLLAQKGPNAELTTAEQQQLKAEGRSAKDIQQLRSNLSMLRQELLSEARIHKIVRDFRELTGRAERPNTAILLELRKIYTEGIAAAWSAALADQGLKVATEVATAFAKELVERERFGLLGSVEKSTSTLVREAEQNYVGDCTAAIVDAVASQGSPMASVQAPAPPVQAIDTPIYDPSISTVIERLVMQKKRQGVSSVTLRQYHSFSILFSTITGVTDVRAIRKQHIARFREVLQQMPRSWGKSPKDARASVMEMLEHARKLPQDQVGLSVGTINRHLDHIGQLLQFASDEGIQTDDRVKPSKLRLREIVRDRDKRSSFRSDELERLFNHSIWRGSKSLRRRNHSGDLIIKDGLYWVPVLASYTGARREELAALTVDDVYEEDGISFLRIAANKNRGVKTLASVRRVPLHYRLIDLGFLDHAEVARRDGQDLFPELRPKQHRLGESSKKYGDRLWYALDQAFKKALDGNPRDLCLHSMRHYVKDRFALDPSTPEKVRLEIIGHEGDNIDSRTYGEESPLRDLKIAIDKLPDVF